MPGSILHASNGERDGGPVAMRVSSVVHLPPSLAQHRFLLLILMRTLPWGTSRGTLPTSCISLGLTPCVLLYTTHAEVPRDLGRQSLAGHYWQLVSQHRVSCFQGPLARGQTIVGSSRTSAVYAAGLEPLQRWHITANGNVCRVQYICTVRTDVPARAGPYNGRKRQAVSQW